MVIYYIVKSFGDICISYTLLFVYCIYCFMVILLPMVNPRFGSIIEQSPIVISSLYTIPYLVFSIDMFKRDCKARDDACRTVWRRFTLIDATGGRF